MGSESSFLVFSVARIDSLTKLVLSSTVIGRISGFIVVERIRVNEEVSSFEGLLSSAIIGKVNKNIKLKITQKTVTFFIIKLPPF